MQCFADKGYLGTTVDDIAVAANSSRATFYLYFESKFAVLAFASMQTQGEWVPRTLRMIDSDGPILRERVEAMVWEAFRHWRENADLLQTLQQAEAVEPGMRNRSLEAIHEVVEESFPRYLARFSGAERDVVRTELVMIVILTFRYMHYEFVVEPHPADAELQTQVLAMTEIVWRQLRFRAPPADPTA